MSPGKQPRGIKMLKNRRIKALALIALGIIILPETGVAQSYEQYQNYADNDADYKTYYRTINVAQTVPAQKIYYSASVHSDNDNNYRPVNYQEVVPEQNMVYQYAPAPYVSPETPQNLPKLQNLEPVDFGIGNNDSPNGVSVKSADKEEAPFHIREPNPYKDYWY